LIGCSVLVYMDCFLSIVYNCLINCIILLSNYFILFKCCIFYTDNFLFCYFIYPNYDDTFLYSFYFINYNDFNVLPFV
jgi:hypothetical protein